MHCDTVPLVKFQVAPHLAYADIPIVYVLELGGEEFLGIRDQDGGFQQIDSLTEVPETDWQQVETFGPGLGLLVPCSADIVNEYEERVGLLNVRIINGRPACASIFAYAHGLTSSFLRQLPIAKMVREATIPNTVRVLIHDKLLFGARYVEGGLGFGQLHADLRKELEAVDERARRRVIDDDFLRTVADLYRRGLELGIAPAQSVEAHLGPTTPANARRWIAAARARGFLGPAPARGKAGELAHLGS